MPSDIYWLEEPVIIYHEMRGRYEADELKAAIAQELALAGQSPAKRVYVLRDLRKLEALPPDLKLNIQN
jgi:hypothetical protein